MLYFVCLNYMSLLYLDNISYWMSSLSLVYVVIALELTRARANVVRFTSKLHRKHIYMLV